MSTAAVKSQAEVVGEVLLIDPAQIDTDEANRIGQFFPLKAEGLASLIGVDGQLVPIGIIKSGSKAKLPWKLVYGRHRLWACHSLGKMVAACVVSGSQEQLRKMQADENLAHREMSVLENSMFVAAIAEAAQSRVLAAHGVTTIEALGAARTNAMDKSVQSAVRDDGQVRFAHPGTVADEIEKADVSAEIIHAELISTYRWKPEVAAACGMDEKKVQRALRIHRQLVLPFPALMEALKEHPVANNASALLKLASIAKEGREAELRALIEGEPEQTEAPAPVDPKVKLYNAALKSLNKMTEFEHDALIEARIDALSLASKRRIFALLGGELDKGGKV